VTDRASTPAEPDRDAESARRAWRVHPLVDRSAAYGWRLLVIAAVVVGLLWLIGELLVVVLPVFAALLICRFLMPAQRGLTGRGLPSGLAAALLTLAFVVALAGIVTFVGASVVSEFDDLDETIDAGIADVEDWLVDDAPFDVDRGQLDQARERVAERLRDVFTRTDGRVTEGATLAAEVATGVVLTLVVTFFLLKDGGRYVRRLDRLPARRAETWRRTSKRAWDALGGYLRGVAILGVVEAITIGIAMFVVGADLVVPVMAITVLGAFVPIVGAVVAGIVAVLVTLATAGLVPALVVAGVAIVVQQLDNDLLAPWIYGRALRLPALAILLGITTGVALFGIVGAFLAVPVLAVGVGIVDELRAIERERTGNDPRADSGDAAQAPTTAPG
jgi:predicted PurR-regulated permease PerM